MNNRCRRLLNEFCVRHSLPMPEPDARDHYLFGFDRIEVRLFEDLGSLYLLAELPAVPEPRDERLRLLEKACGYLFAHLYLDECALNLYNGEDLALVTILDGSDDLDPDDLEQRLADLVNRAEALVAHLAAPSRASGAERFMVFRP